VKKVLCSRESPFANCLSGAPGGDYLSRAIVNCKEAPTTDTAFMGTHLLPIDHNHGNVSTPATRCAIGIMPVAVSLSNAPPTATPSSVMSRYSSFAAPGLTALAVRPARGGRGDDRNLLRQRCDNPKRGEHSPRVCTCTYTVHARPDVRARARLHLHGTVHGRRGWLRDRIGVEPTRWRVQE
jgi:hypothetical protein